MSDDQPEASGPSTGESETTDPIPTGTTQPMDVVTPPVDSGDLTHREKVEDLIVPPLEAGRAYLIVIRGRSVGRMLELDAAPAILGRQTDADLQVDDQGVSRRHAQVAKDAGVYVISDLGATNGLFVNGARVQRHVLANGDRVHLGTATLLKFCYQDEVEEAYQKRMYDAATRDALTGVFNRRYFQDALASQLASSRRHSQPMALLLFDIDHFKKVNDEYGHLAGDEALQQVAKLIARGLRAEDVLARYGGEEFVALLRNGDARGATIFAERARERIADHVFEHAGAPFRITTSVGIASTSSGTYDTPAQILEAADALLLEAKRTGRNRTVAP